MTSRFATIVGERGDGAAEGPGGRPDEEEEAERGEAEERGSLY